jgi:hypothetical protein
MHPPHGERLLCEFYQKTADMSRLIRNVSASDEAALT